MAWSMSNASPARTSPITIRSGRIRSALRTRSRWVTWPSPSILAGRVSKRMTCGRRIWSSAGSSMVITRSVSGMKDDKTFSSVVLPAPVPPETTIFSRIWTHASSKSAISAASVPKRIRSSTLYGSWENLRMVIAGLSIASGGMMAFTREPSGRRASTMGELSSMRRLSGATTFSMMRKMCAESLNRFSLKYRTPPRSKYTWSGRLTITSDTVGSSSSV